MPVAAAPPERLPICPLQPGEIDPPSSKRLELLNRKIGTDDADELHRGEKARGRRKKCRRPTEDIIRFSERRFD
jgi:hypothetical protein